MADCPLCMNRFPEVVAYAPGVKTAIVTEEIYRISIRGHLRVCISINTQNTTSYEMTLFLG